MFYRSYEDIYFSAHHSLQPCSQQNRWVSFDTMPHEKNKVLLFEILYIARNFRWVFIFVTESPKNKKLTHKNLDSKQATMMMCSGHTMKIIP